MFFHVFIFDVYEVELIHQNEIKNQTIQRYKIRIVKSFQIHIFILEPVQPTSTVQNIFCHEIGLSVRGCFETSILSLIHRYNSLRFSAFRMHFWSIRNRLRLLSFEKRPLAGRNGRFLFLKTCLLVKDDEDKFCWRRV